MNFLDTFIVASAHRIGRVVMAIGTGLVYVQAVGLIVIAGAALVGIGYLIVNMLTH